MSQTIALRVDDTAPNIPIVCKYKSGAIVNITGCTVNFYIVNSDGTTTNTGHTACTLVDPTAGTCIYDLTAGDIPIAGSYTGLTKITLAGTEVQSEIKTHILIVSSKYGG